MSWLETLHLGEVVIILVLLLMVGPIIAVSYDGSLGAYANKLDISEVAKFILPTFAALLGYQTWRRNTRSAVVDYALRRKNQPIR